LHNPDVSGHISSWLDVCIILSRNQMPTALPLAILLDSMFTGTTGSDFISANTILVFFSFPDRDSALVAFSIFDRDDNGDATRDEFEMATMQLHREKLALEASMRDLDGAVRRLDDILMVIVFVIACLIFATMLSSKISTFVSAKHSLVLIELIPSLLHQ
jgi:hypothetical protein